MQKRNCSPTLLCGHFWDRPTRMGEEPRTEGRVHAVDRDPSGRGRRGPQDGAPISIRSQV